MSHDHDGSSDTEPEPSHDDSASVRGPADDQPSDEALGTDGSPVDGAGDREGPTDRSGDTSATSNEVDSLAQDVEAIDEALEGVVDPDGEAAGSVLHAAHFSGPLPSPEMLQQYEGVLPGLADRIVAMAETDVEIRRERASSVHRALDEESNLSRSAMEINAAKDRRAQWIAAGVAVLVSILSVFGMYLTPWAAIGFAVPLAQIAVAIAPSRE